jgi:hypothetical protein
MNGAPAPPQPDTIVWHVVRKGRRATLTATATPDGVRLFSQSGATGWAHPLTGRHDLAAVAAEHLESWQARGWELEPA